MLRRILGRSFFALAFVAIAYGIAQTDGFQQCSRTEHQATAKQSITKEYVAIPFICGVEFLDSHNGLVAALAGILVAGFTLALWQATNALTRVAIQQDKTTKEFQRPWLLLDAFEMNGWPQHPIPTQVIPFVSYEFRNSGPSPAFITTYAINFRYSDQPLPETPDYGEITEWPRQPVSNKPWDRQKWLEAPLVEAERTKAENGGVFFFGFVQYEDVFGMTHESRFCYRWIKLPMFGEPKFFRYGNTEYHRHT